MYCFLIVFSIWFFFLISLSEIQPRFTQHYWNRFSLCPQFYWKPTDINQHTVLSRINQIFQKAWIFDRYKTTFVSPDSYWKSTNIINTLSFSGQTKITRRNGSLIDIKQLFLSTFLLTTNTLAFLGLAKSFRINGSSSIYISLFMEQAEGNDDLPHKLMMTPTMDFLVPHNWQPPF